MPESPVQIIHFPASIHCKKELKKTFPLSATFNWVNTLIRHESRCNERLYKEFFLNSLAFYHASAPINAGGNNPTIGRENLKYRSKIFMNRIVVDVKLKDHGFVARNE